jgi:sugar-specific transcriptional regulator TrmB
MDISQQLKIAGLNHSEITVYLFLLENGISTPPIVSRGTKIARTNCYNILNSLKDQGLIEQQILKKRKAYLATDPQSLVRTLQKKKEAIEQILPDLRGLYTTQKNKPKIRFYEGFDQVREIYHQTLSAKEIFAIGSTKQINELMPGYLEYYFEEVRKRGIFFKDILTNNSEPTSKDSKNFLKGLYEAKLLPEKYPDLPTDILIWNNNIALINLKEPVFGTILNNPLLAQTFKTLFELIWTR